MRWLVVAPLSVVLGYLLDLWNVPAAWIIGPLVVSAACALITGKELPINRYLFRYSRGTIGVLAALPLVAVGIHKLSHYLLPGLCVAAFTILMAIIGGTFLGRSHREIGLETGIMSMLAGGASVMPLIAKEVGADYRYVALNQYLRLLAVSISLPLVSGWLLSSGSTPTSEAPAQDIAGWVGLVIIFAVALGSESLARLVHIPSPSIIGPILVMLIVANIVPDSIALYPPKVMRVVAFLVVGWLCGGSLSKDSLKLFSKLLPLTLAFVAFLIGTCALAAWPLTAWLDISYFEGYLATTPGAIDTVLALTSESGAGAVVVSMQVIRLLTILVFASYLPQFLRFYRRIIR
ncbi:membrane protein AbrB duplication [Corynebacterium pyruviciproducens ATCC BAA-1742]|uniref:Membrane protein AbrB duplication n=1 Tax=Corynebacterium pyruviciproducens ATCC BAA-1742 TaxID=1125779 RepID=S2ZIG0_9CORY|nr:AbrB family transcriptional regulator [Corynebacterium pyruviciproducens]EPD69852.1 membrane protein AbrB duplication [Corynebacterium pyruviciproducens ATCC BAA-1742]